MLGRKDIPDLISITNGTLGVFAIMYAIDGAFEIAGALILVAVLMDGLDGAAARWLDAETSLGKEIDSIADMVSFTMAPAVLIYAWHYDQGAGSSLQLVQGYTYDRAVNLLTVLASGAGMLLGMYRLMRYRSSDHELPYFRGVPTPAYAFFVVTSIHLLAPMAFLPVAAVASLLMVTHIRYSKVKGLLALPALAGLALALAGTVLPWARTALMAPAFALIVFYIATPLFHSPGNVRGKAGSSGGHSRRNRR